MSKKDTFDWSIFVGIPFIEGGRDIGADGGLDCWGLVRTVYQKKCDVLLDAYEAVQFGPHTVEQELFKKATACWTKLENEEPRPTDVILFRFMGLPLHVACYIKPGWMLHSRGSNAGSTIERYTTPMWNQRIEGFYRYVG